METKGKRIWRRVKEVFVSFLTQPIYLLLPLCLLAFSSLALVFLSEQENLFTYLVYILCFILLLPLCYRFILLARCLLQYKDLIKTYSKKKHFLVFTFAYAISLLAMWLFQRDAILLLSGVYYLILCAVRYFEKKWLYPLLLLHLFFLYLHLIEHPEMKVLPYNFIYAVALYAFIKVISTSVSFARKRGEPVSLISAVYSIFHLQLSLLAQFSSDVQFEVLMNRITGGAALLITGVLCAYAMARTHFLSHEQNGISGE